LGVRVLGYARTLDVAGKSAKVDVVVPYGFLSGTADVAGQPRDREVSGFGDPKLRFSMNFFGAPALAAQEFARYRQDWIMGMSVQVGVPLGQYDDERVVNLGTHRWSIKPELGVSKALGRWTLELRGGCHVLYRQRRLLRRSNPPSRSRSIPCQGHLLYTFASRVWLGLDGTYYEGGIATIDGVESSDRCAARASGSRSPCLSTRRTRSSFFAHSGISVRTVPTSTPSAPLGNTGGAEALR
jgi:hypothetical protein